MLIILGGAECVWEDLDAAQALLSEHETAAVNDIGVFYSGRLAFWATLHMEKVRGWYTAREALGYPMDFLSVSRQTFAGARIDRVMPERWCPGSSGLYAVQVALALGYRRIVLCGVPMEPVAHFYDDRLWGECLHYRQGWEWALPEISPFVRSMSGWTRERLGEPTKAWASMPS